ncbi:unnamed protein product [marine sediment metagenome]|uniref:Uncharacterized protein n=1 Tax=marine sediment metagenome TaxID=412755 RepID=X0TCK0_9ZZZZ
MKPRTLQQLKDHEAVSFVSQEHNGSYGEPDDYWVYLNDGWINEEAETTCIHETGVKATVQAFNWYAVKI